MLHRASVKSAVKRQTSVTTSNQCKHRRRCLSRRCSEWIHCPYRTWFLRCWYACSHGVSAHVWQNVIAIACSCRYWLPKQFNENLTVWWRHSAALAEAARPPALTLARARALRHLLCGPSLIPTDVVQRRVKPSDIRDLTGSVEANSLSAHPVIR